MDELVMDREISSYLLEILDKLDKIEEALSLQKSSVKAASREKRTLLTVEVSPIDTEDETAVQQWKTLVKLPGTRESIDSGSCGGSTDKAYLKALYIGLQQLSFTNRGKGDLLIRCSEPLICDIIEGEVEESTRLLDADAQDYVKVVQVLLAQFSSVEVEYTG
jgi:hypothetical protein